MPSNVSVSAIKLVVLTASRLVLYINLSHIKRPAAKFEYRSLRPFNGHLQRTLTEK